MCEVFHELAGVAGDLREDFSDVESSRHREASMMSNERHSWKAGMDVALHAIQYVQDR